MESIQLRPGNLVKVSAHGSSRISTGKVFIISEVNNDGVFLMHSDNDTMGAIFKISYNDILPITLTDDWRERLGLIYRTGKNEWVWDNNHIDWSLSKFEGWRKEQYHYVHEIQNLFYFIHDVELEVRELELSVYS